MIIRQQVKIKTVALIIMLKITITFRLRFLLVQELSESLVPGTKIKFLIPHQLKVTIEVFDMLCKELETLIRG